MHFPGYAKFRIFRKSWKLSCRKKLRPGRNFVYKQNWDMGFCHTPRIRGVFWCPPILRRSDQSECDVDRFGISDLAGLSRSPRRPGSGVRARKSWFFEGFLSLTSRTSAHVPKEMAGELFTTFLAIKKNIIYCSQPFVYLHSILVNMCRIYISLFFSYSIL